MLQYTNPPTPQFCGENSLPYQGGISQHKKSSLDRGRWLKAGGVCFSPDKGCCSRS